MKMKSKYILPILGIVAAVGIGIGASPRAVNSANDIIFGENGPIKLISPNGAVLLKTASQTVTSNEMILTYADLTKEKISNLLVKRYPFFILDLNDGLSIEDTLALGESANVWFGVELKASTNNFGMALKPIQASTEEKTPCFWSCTDVGGPHYDFTMDDCIAFTIVTDGDNPLFDNRGWVHIEGTLAATMSLLSLDEKAKVPRKIGILLSPELLKTTKDNPGWLRSDNEEIVWSYMRTDLTGYETNSTGKAIWTMCEPVCWFENIPRWATNNVSPHQYIPTGN